MLMNTEFGHPSPKSSTRFPSISEQPLIHKGRPMNSKRTSDNSTPHLTPANLVGRQFSPDTFKGITVALVGYCPRLHILDKYNPMDTNDQYFIHVPPESVKICDHNGIEFLSIYHVYGGPVSSALIEELAYYGIKYILAYGLAGGLGTQNLKMADFYIVESALAMDGTTPHYTEDKLILSDGSLNSRIKELADKSGLPELMPVQALTVDAIYREYEPNIKDAREKGCDIVNCDSSHLFAVSRSVGIKSTECGLISDVVKSGEEEWKSSLSAMLSSKDVDAQDPLVLLGKMAEFYVKVLIQDIVRG